MAGYSLRSLDTLSKLTRGFFTQSITGAITSLWANTFTVVGKVLALLDFEHEQRRAWLYDQIFASRADAVWLARHGFELGLTQAPASTAAGTILAATRAVAAIAKGVRIPAFGTSTPVTPDLTVIAPSGERTLLLTGPADDRPSVGVARALEHSVRRDAEPVTNRTVTAALRGVGAAGGASSSTTNSTVIATAVAGAARGSTIMPPRSRLARASRASSRRDS